MVWRQPSLGSQCASLASDSGRKVRLHHGLRRFRSDRHKTQCTGSDFGEAEGTWRKPFIPTLFVRKGADESQPFSLVKERFVETKAHGVERILRRSFFASTPMHKLQTASAKYHNQHAITYIITLLCPFQQKYMANHQKRRSTMFFFRRFSSPFQDYDIHWFSTTTSSRPRGVHIFCIRSPKPCNLQCSFPSGVQKYQYLHRFLHAQNIDKALATLQNPIISSCFVQTPWLKERKAMKEETGNYQPQVPNSAFFHICSTCRKPWYSICVHISLDIFLDYLLQLHVSGRFDFQISFENLYIIVLICINTS